MPLQGTGTPGFLSLSHISNKQVRSNRLSPIDYLYRGLAHGPDAIAIAGPGAPVTYRELVAVVEALATGLQSLDATPGSRVGICARNTPEHLIALLATYAAGSSGPKASDELLARDKRAWLPIKPERQHLTASNVC